MFCYKCGHKNTDQSKFCVECGTELNTVTAATTIKLTCEDCKGVMEVDVDKQIISCPYCGSKKFVKESDEVTIARIDKQKAIDKMRHEKEMKEYDEELRKKRDKEDWKLLGIMWGVAIILWLIFFFV